MLYLPTRDRNEEKASRMRERQQNTWVIFLYDLRKGVIIKSNTFPQIHMGLEPR